MKICPLTAEDLKKLNEEKLAVYRQFLKKEFWPCLQGNDPWGIDSAEIFALMAMTDEDIPAAFALISMRKSLYWAVLLSFTFRSPNTVQTIGKQLLDQLESFLREQHYHLLSYIYSDFDPEINQIEALLKQSGWGDPKLLLVRCHFEGHQFDAPWFKRYIKAHLPENFEFFPWAKLKPRERELLEHKQEEGTFPFSVSPFFQEKSIEPLNSLGVRYKGDVIGWMITNRLAPDTIGYSSFFVEPEYRETTIPLCMVAKSIFLQLHSNVEHGIIEMNPTQSDQSWRTFFKNRFMPSAQRVERLYEVCHDLSSDEWKNARAHFVDFDDDM